METGYASLVIKVAQMRTDNGRKSNTNAAEKYWKTQRAGKNITGGKIIYFQ